MRRLLLIAAAALVLAATTGEAAEKRIRLAATAGGVTQNEILDRGGYTAGGGVHLAYPVSDPGKPLGLELSIANWYNAVPAEDRTLHLLRIGFGIRVFLNTRTVVRPYFTHDICSHLVWVSDRPGYATGTGILLGLGVDVPVRTTGAAGVGGSSSIFADLSVSSFRLAYFGEHHQSARFLAASIGYSWLLRGGD